MNTITNLNTFPIGNSLDGINIITDEINTLSLLVDGTNSMLADLNMNNHIIKNMEAGVDSLDAVNKSQLDLKADKSYVDLQDTYLTTYVNSQLALKVNKAGDTMTGALNMNSTNKIINLANGTNNGDAVNRSQLNTKADTSYVNTQLGLKVNKAGDTMTGALNMNSTNKIINLANGTSNGDAVNLGQLTAINNSLTADINDLENYVDTQDTALRIYTDSSLNLLRDYVNTQDNLKVNKNGDTMSGALTLSGSTPIYLNGNPATTNSASLLYATNFNECILAVNAGTSDRGFDLRVSTGNPLSSSTRLWVQPDGKVGINTRTPTEIFDVNGNAIVRGSLDMSSNKIINVANATDSADAINFAQLTDLRNYTDASLNLKVDRAGDTMTGVLTINKNASNFTNLDVNSSQTIDIKSGNPLYQQYTLTYTGTGTTFRLPYITQSDTTLINKTIAFKITGGTQVFLTSLPLTGSFTTINVDGVNYVSTTLTKSSSFILKSTGTVGYYTTHTYVDIESTDEVQLTLKSNLDTNANTEFTGIRFLNTNTEAGLIKVETDRDHNNSIMRFYTRSSNNTIFPFEIGSSITAYKPTIFSDIITANGNITSNGILTANGNITANGVITRNAWSSGELIKTTIFSRATTGVSKVANVNPNTSLDWLFPTLTLRNTPTNSIIVMNFDAPYHFTGSGQDTIELYVYDTTGGTANLVFAKSQYYDGAGGGGTRSNPIFPFTFSHTPSQATTTATRTYKITLFSRSGDTLRLCQGVFNGSVINLDYYTCEMKEIKI